LRPGLKPSGPGRPLAPEAAHPHGGDDGEPRHRRHHRLRWHARAEGPGSFYPLKLVDEAQLGPDGLKTVTRAQVISLKKG
jgi:hypothetical protein